MIFFAFVCLFAFALADPTALEDENRALRKVNLALTKALGELEKATETDQEAQVGYEVSCQHDYDCTGKYYICAHGRCSMPTVATDTDQETQVGYEVSCQHDYDCTGKYYICLDGRCSMPTVATHTDQEAQVGYRVDCQHDDDCTKKYYVCLAGTCSMPYATESSFDFAKIGDSYCSGDQNNKLKNLGRISVQRCAETCSQTEGCTAIQMDCGTDCFLLPACTRPKRSGCGSHSYSVGATNDATSEEQEVGATDRKF